MKGPVVRTPRGAVSLDSKGQAKLVWNTASMSRFQKQYSLAQKFVDSEILRYSEPFTPLLTGTLIKTGILGTDIGSGLVQWIAPYAKFQYYRPAKHGTVTGPLRGPFWFERMKQVRGRTIIAGARKIAGGG